MAQLDRRGANFFHVHDRVVELLVAGTDIAIGAFGMLDLIVEDVDGLAPLAERLSWRSLTKIRSRPTALGCALATDSSVSATIFVVGPGPRSTTTIARIRFRYFFGAYPRAPATMKTPSSQRLGGIFRCRPRCKRAQGGPRTCRKSVVEGLGRLLAFSATPKSAVFS